MRLHLDDSTLFLEESGENLRGRSFGSSESLRISANQPQRRGRHHPPCLSLSGLAPAPRQSRYRRRREVLAVEERLRRFVGSNAPRRIQGVSGLMFAMNALPVKTPP